jgi:hypothetical protein
MKKKYERPDICVHEIDMDMMFTEMTVNRSDCDDVEKQLSVKDIFEDGFEDNRTES